MEFELSSKEYARILYHIDKNTRAEKKDKIDYEALYKDICKKLEDSLGVSLLSKKDDIEFSKKLDKEDEKLVWKLKFMQEEQHRLETEEDNEIELD